MKHTLDYVVSGTSYMRLSNPNIAFDETNTGSAGTSNDPIPEGEYLCEIISVEVKPAKENPANKMLVVEWVLENGRRVWDRLNLWHTESPSAVEMATKRFNQLGVAVGLQQISDTDQMILKRAMVSIAIQANNSQYNEIKGYAPPVSATRMVNPPINAIQAPMPAQAGAPQLSPAPATAQAAPAAKAFPWEN